VIGPAPAGEIIFGASLETFLGPILICTIPEGFKKSHHLSDTRISKKQEHWAEEKFVIGELYKETIGTVA
jgi:hypothetical protein